MVVIGIAGLVGVVLWGAVRSSVSGGGDGVTDAAAFDLPALDGPGRVRLADHRGRPVVVNFFASWCDVCDLELVDFREAATRLSGQVDFIFVNSNETGDWRPMARRTGIAEGFVLARDIKGTRGNGLYRSLGGTGGMPITAFYDADGRLLHTQFGGLVGPALEQALSAILGVTVDV